jgi:hypothetical protein
MFVILEGRHSLLSTGSTSSFDVPNDIGLAVACCRYVTRSGTRSGWEPAGSWWESAGAASFPAGELFIMKICFGFYNGFYISISYTLACFLFGNAFQGCCAADCA